jgi:hypothetical protein
MKFFRGAHVQVQESIIRNTSEQYVTPSKFSQDVLIIVEVMDRKMKNSLNAKEQRTQMINL